MPPKTTAMPLHVKYKTRKNFNDEGHAHSLTFSCFQRQPFLSKDRTCQWLADAINKTRTSHALHIWAYVFMPEHVHLLLWPTRRKYDISTIRESIKLPVTRRAVPFVKREAPDFLPRMLDLQPNGKHAYRFWQRGGGHDRNITEPKTALAEVEYYHFNPVRRGLCEKPEDWYWSSAADHAGLRVGPIPIDRDSLPWTWDP